MHAQRVREQEIYSQRQSDLSNKNKISRLEKELAALTPDPAKWEMVDFVDIGNYLITKVKFDTCEHAGFGGHKVLVFKATVKEAMLWRRMDPHFKEAPAQGFAKNEAPVPIARFPASEEGWQDARLFAISRVERESNAGIRGAKSTY